MVLSWLNPIALWSLLALAIPVGIHLWSKNKTKEIAFGSIQFLKESSTLQSKKIQLSEIPLLLLRLLILILAVMMLARWVSMKEIKKEKALLVESKLEIPKAYGASDENLMVLQTDAFESSLNQWNTMEKLSQEYPEIDSLTYIGNFDDTDFFGAIPKLKFKLELVNSGDLNNRIRNQGSLAPDTLLIHFDQLPKSIEYKIDNLLKANNLYTNKKVNFRKSEKHNAQLIIANSRQNLKTNQIIFTDSISGNYEKHRKHNYSILYLNKKWMNNPINEDVFLFEVSEFMAQIVVPNYHYTSFENIYTRSGQKAGTKMKAQTFDLELATAILLLFILERFFSYRKRNA